MTGAAGSAVGRLWPASMHLCRAGCHRLLGELPNALQRLILCAWRCRPRNLLFHVPVAQMRWGQGSGGLRNGLGGDWEER